jgi:hypothetical protein
VPPLAAISDSPLLAKVAGLLRASCPPPYGPAFGCSKSLPAILSPCTLPPFVKRINAIAWNACAATSPAHQRRQADGCGLPKARSGHRLPLSALPPNASPSMARAGSCTVTSNPSVMARADQHANGASFSARKPHHSLCWRYPRGAGTARLHRPAGRPGPQAAFESHPLPRSIRPELQASQTHRATAFQAHRRRPPARPDDLDATPQARLRH